VAELADQAGPTVEDRVQALAQKDPVKLVDALFDTTMAAALKDEARHWCSPTPPHWLQGATWRDARSSGRFRQRRGRTGQSAINDRCWRLLPFSYWSVNDSDQPED
jgi:hypothetical protein